MTDEEVLAKRGELYATPATERDILNVALRLRDEDRSDVEALLPGRVREAVILTAYKALWCVSIRRVVDDLAVALIGLGNGADEETGTPWMLSAEELFDHPRAVARYTRWFLDRMHARFPVLVNWTDMRNGRTLRWLRWAGATIFDPEPFGVFGLPFHRFEFRR